MLWVSHAVVSGRRGGLEAPASGGRWERTLSTVPPGGRFRGPLTGQADRSGPGISNVGMTRPWPAASEGGGGRRAIRFGFLP